MTYVILITIIIGLIIAFYLYATKVTEGRKLKTIEAQEELDRLYDKIQTTKQNLQEKEKKLTELISQKTEIDKGLAALKKEEEILSKSKEEKLINLSALEAKTATIEEKYSAAEDSAKDEYLSLLSERKDELLAAIEEIKETQKKLESNKQTYQASVKFIEPSATDRKLSLNSATLADLALLNSIRHKLIKADALDKVLWDVYFKAPTKELTKSFSGACGIYKIENLVTHQIYIGQSVDVATRWTAHIKSGIAAMNKTSSNKLYSSMAEYGLENFSFSIVEECGRDLLNEKEKFWIDFTNSKETGLNSTSGNN